MDRVVRHTRLLITMLVITVAWSLSSLGYFWLLPLLDAELGYNDAPVFYAFYYAAWAGMAVWFFHVDIDRWALHHQPPQSYIMPAVLLFVFAGYALFLLPRLPAIDLPVDQLPETFLAAGAQYFLPKSFEILFQQILIVALVLALHARKFELAQLSALTALLFGGFHLSLALNGENWFYVTRYTVAASAYGALVPLLILRVPSGFAISYAVHWSFYAVDLAIGHFVLGSSG